MAFNKQEIEGIKDLYKNPNGSFDKKAITADLKIIRNRIKNTKQEAIKCNIDNTKNAYTKKIHEELTNGPGGLVELIQEKGILKKLLETFGLKKS